MSFLELLACVRMRMRVRVRACVRVCARVRVCVRARGQEPPTPSPYIY